MSDGGSLILPPDLSSDERDHLWKEYSALEARMHNDSRVSYALMAALLAAGITLLATSLQGFASINLEPKGVSAVGITSPFLLGILSWLAVKVATIVQERFRDTGRIRQARAIQIEHQLKVYSFRLFHPWVRTSDDVPKGYFCTLGKITWPGKTWAQWENEYFNEGSDRHFEICTGASFSHQLNRVKWTVFSLVALAFGVTVLHAALLWLT
jgi:hypothetical protein